MFRIGSIWQGLWRVFDMIEDRPLELVQRGDF